MRTQHGKIVKENPIKFLFGAQSICILFGEDTQLRTQHI